MPVRIPKARGTEILSFGVAGRWGLCAPLPAAAGRRGAVSHPDGALGSAVGAQHQLHGAAGAAGHPMPVGARRAGCQEDGEAPAAGEDGQEGRGPTSGWALTPSSRSDGAQFNTHGYGAGMRLHPPSDKQESMPCFLARTSATPLPPLSALVIDTLQSHNFGFKVHNKQAVREFDAAQPTDTSNTRLAQRENWAQG